MRKQAIILATALVMVPLGAESAELVVWWEKGFYPQEDEAVADIIAAFEQESGNQVELVQPAQYEVNDKARAALAAGQPPDFLYGTIAVWGRRAHEDQLAELEDVLARSWSCSTPTPSRRLCRSTAGRVGAGCTGCRWAGVPTTFMSGTAF
jgi:ABC-type glycerol-3-phosphate transport system substrate-binding protein